MGYFMDGNCRLVTYKAVNSNLRNASLLNRASRGQVTRAVPILSEPFLFDFSFSLLSACFLRGPGVARYGAGYGTGQRIR
jgi:hypothetical protein